VDSFWLPAQNKTESWIRLGGYALLLIEYKDYTLTDTSPLGDTQNARVMQSR
jgi:hypothetical protein